MNFAIRGLALAILTTAYFLLPNLSTASATPPPQDDPTQGYIFTVDDYYHGEGRVTTGRSCGTGSFVGISASGNYYIGRTNAHVVRGRGQRITLTMNVNGTLRRFVAIVGQSWYRSGLSLDITRLWIPKSQLDSIGFEPKIARQLPLDFSLSVGDVLYSVASPRCINPQMQRKRVTRVTDNLVYHWPQAIGGESGSQLYWTGDPDGTGSLPHATYDAGLLTWGTNQGGGQGISQSHQLVQQVFALSGAEAAQVSTETLDQLPSHFFELGKVSTKTQREESGDKYSLSELIRPLPPDLEPLAEQVQCGPDGCPIFQFTDEPKEPSEAPTEPPPAEPIAPDVIQPPSRPPSFNVPVPPQQFPDEPGDGPLPNQPVPNPGPDLAPPSQPQPPQRLRPLRRLFQRLLRRRGRR